MDLTFKDLVLLADKGSVEKDGITVSVGKPVIADIEVDPVRSTGFVRFKLDESDPRSKTALLDS